MCAAIFLVPLTCRDSRDYTQDFAWEMANLDRSQSVLAVNSTIQRHTWCLRKVGRALVKTSHVFSSYFQTVVRKPELVLAAHEGLVCVLQRSPFFKDILLSIGGWTFAIWKEGVSVN